MIIRNGNIFTQNEKFQEGQVYINGKKIEKISYEDDLSIEKEIVLDAEDMYVLPGLVDIHSHGALGCDFCDATATAFRTLEDYQLKNGVTTLCAATMTLSYEELEDIIKAFRDYKDQSRGVISGITMEGPFLSYEKKGAQNALYIRKPDIEFLKKMQEKSGSYIKQVAIAPETELAMEFIETAAKEMVVSLAHTTADYETAERAFESGATHVTHLFNGMNPFSHREPGVIGAAFDKKDVYVELICDGVHIHPAMVRSAFRLFGAKRVCMISDSIRAAGMKDGEYSLGGQKVFLNTGVATLEDGTIAGSVCNLYECLKKAVKEMQIPLEDAVLSATKTPAMSLGMEKECGILAEGRNADILVLDKNLDIRYVMKNGEIIEK